MAVFSRIILLLIACTLLAGCVTEGPVAPEHAKPKPMPREVTYPVKLIVSPLTRIGLEGVGGPSLFMHLEFRDAGEKNVKAFGRIHVELFQPAPAGGGGDAKAQPMAQAWDADLSDPVRNALTFDEMITRTYTINLTGIPDWLVQWSRHQGDVAVVGAPSVIVQFTPSDSSDPSRVLRVAYTLTR